MKCCAIVRMSFATDVYPLRCSLYTVSTVAVGLGARAGRILSGLGWRCH